VGEGVEGLLDQVGQFRGSVVLNPGEDGGAGGGKAGRDGDPVLETVARVALVRAEGVQDEFLGGDLVRP
jgi:hypothetical protein